MFTLHNSAEIVAKVVQLKTKHKQTIGKKNIETIPCVNTDIILPLFTCKLQSHLNCTETADTFRKDVRVPRMPGNSQVRILAR